MAQVHSHPVGRALREAASWLRLYVAEVSAIIRSSISRTIRQVGLAITRIRDAVLSALRYLASACRLLIRRVVNAYLSIEHWTARFLAELIAFWWAVRSFLLLLTVEAVLIYSAFQFALLWIPAAALALAFTFGIGTTLSRYRYADARLPEPYSDEAIRTMTLWVRGFMRFALMAVGAAIMFARFAPGALPAQIAESWPTSALIADEDRFAGALSSSATAWVSAHEFQVFFPVMLSFMLFLFTSNQRIEPSDILDSPGARFAVHVMWYSSLTITVVGAALWFAMWSSLGYPWR